MDTQKDILWRIYLVYIMICILGVSVIVQVFRIQLIEGEEWRKKAENRTLNFMSIEAARGNIYASDGHSLLATDLPLYEIRMDVCTEALTDKIFYENVDSLALELSLLFKNKSYKQYKKDLISARTYKNRYLLIKNNVRYTELKQLKNFPLFRKGRYKGGMIVIQKNKRKRPFKMLAQRTIGYEREHVQPVGLEGAYSDELVGVNGQRLMQKIAKGVWIPVNDDNEIEPRDGNDLITTIDINMQDVAEHALEKQLKIHNANHGCVVVMEVKTGKIKAIANLKKGSNENYYEAYNYAVGEAIEPGSTFKIASMLALLEDNLILLTDSVALYGGEYIYYDKKMRDSHKPESKKVTALKAFEVSSNVGVSQLVYQNYSKDPQKYIDKLYQFHLNESLDVEISGEGKAYIKTVNDKDWSGVSLPWMSIGYELRLTPLQVLTFYNTIANNGKMMKPIFVDEIRYRGQTIKQVHPEIIDKQICSMASIKQAQILLENVVESGTASKIKSPYYKIAGKTGTAQKSKNGKYSKSNYIASFVGYFPADDPEYSCIVVIDQPQKNMYYGSQVAAPVFREISDKIYINNISIQHDEPTWTASYQVPYCKNGNWNDLKLIMDSMNINYQGESNDLIWVQTRSQGKYTEIKELKSSNGIVPNVVGMGMKDAVYLLEQQGLIVKFSGRGMVHHQSIASGIKTVKGKTIYLELI